MLLNEFLKQHRRGEEQDRKIQEQETTIAELRWKMKALAATVNEQASELRKVGAQLQMNNAARMISREPVSHCALAAEIAAASTNAIEKTARSRRGLPLQQINKYRYRRCSRNRREWNANARGCPIRTQDD
jgi:hypothetical protein